jgi:hypothetical protein
MKYFVAIETLHVTEVEANTEDEALEIVRNQLDPRAPARLSIATEVELNDEPTVDAVSGECGTDSGDA